MPFLTAEQLENLLPFPELIAALRRAFAENYFVPLRHHHDYPIPGQEGEGALLLMPAWDEGRHFGVKLVAVNPHNRLQGLPTIQGMYTLFDTPTGAPVMQADAKALTNLRTAAASALAASFLSRPDSHTLLMVGAGALAPFLIRAHASVRPIGRVLVWGRNPLKARSLAENMERLGYEAAPVSHLPSALPEADIISCATLSAEPLVLGQWLRPGQHLDLVGSFKPNMREADSQAIRRARVYVDTLEGATREAGDIVQPIREGVLKVEDICGDLFRLCRKECPCRQKPEEITLFKSVGHALEDLAAAKMAWEGFCAESR